MPELRLRLTLHACWRHLACAAGSCKRSPGTRGGSAWALCNMQTDFFTFIGGCCCCCCCCCRLVCGKHSASKPIPTQFHKRTPSPLAPATRLLKRSFLANSAEKKRETQKRRVDHWKGAEQDDEEGEGVGRGGERKRCSVVAFVLFIERCLMCRMWSSRIGSDSGSGKHRDSVSVSVSATVAVSVSVALSLYLFHLCAATGNKNTQQKAGNTFNHTLASWFSMQREGGEEGLRLKGLGVATQLAN